MACSIFVHFYREWLTLYINIRNNFRLFILYVSKQHYKEGTHGYKPTIDHRNHAAAGYLGSALTTYFSRATRYHAGWPVCRICDALGQLIRVDDEQEGATWEYTYDQGGNILSNYE